MHLALTFWFVEPFLDGASADLCLSVSLVELRSSPGGNATEVPIETARMTPFVSFGDLTRILDDWYTTSCPYESI